MFENKFLGLRGGKHKQLLAKLESAASKNHADGRVYVRAGRIEFRTRVDWRLSTFLIG